MRVSRSKSAWYSPSASAIQSGTVTMTRRIGSAAGSAISRSRKVCSSQPPDARTRRS